MPANNEPIFDPMFWKQRLAEAVDREAPRHAVYKGNLEDWHRRNIVHTKILSQTIMPKSRVLDVGCAWGRLTSLIPQWWTGDYVGVDLSPDFIELAKLAHYDKRLSFHCRDARNGLADLGKFDWAVFLGIRQMVIGNAGGVEWDRILDTVQEVADMVLILEFESDDWEVIKKR